MASIDGDMQPGERGYFGIGITYKNGTDEDIGMFTQVYHFGLTGED